MRAEKTPLAVMAHWFMGSADGPPNDLAEQAASDLQDHLADEGWELRRRDDENG